MARHDNFRAVGIFLVLHLVCFAFVSSSVILSRHLREDDDDHDHHDHEEGETEYFALVGNYLLEQELAEARETGDFTENHDQNITTTQAELLVSTLFSRLDCENRFGNCSQCASDFVTDLFTALNVEVLSEGDFYEAAPRLLYAAFRIEDVCSDGASGLDLSEEAVFEGLFAAEDDDSNTTLTEHDLEEIFHNFTDYYTPTTNAECFDVETVFTETVVDHEAGANETEVHALAEVVVAKLLQGYCIGEATAPKAEDFIDAVFDTYGTDHVIHEEEFETLLAALGIGGESNHTAGEETGHEGHNHRRRRAAAQSVAAAVGSVFMNTRQRRAADDHDHDHADEHGDELNVSATCYTGEELLDFFGVDHEAGVTEDNFISMAPSLLQQILSGACSVTVTDEHAEGISDAAIWGFGTLAVLIISLCSVIGALFVPCMTGFVHEAVIQTMIALAVATLSGDAILHLIPQAVGLHAHDASSHGSEAHGPTSPELAYVWKCLVVQLSIYGFFVLEQIASMMSCCKHSHSHDNVVSVQMGETRNSARAYKNQRDLNSSTRELTKDDPNGDMKKNDRIKGCNTTAMMIVLGDSLHNFGDGLAIGAAFTLGVPAGLSTSVAVLCHELPHELGDLAILLNQGMGLGTAVFLNFVSACTAFLGLWVGIPLAQTQEARLWIFAVAAGMFLYVGLVTMLPQLHAYKGERRGLIVVLQNIGFLLGVLIILIIALYEDAIDIAI